MFTGSAVSRRALVLTGCAVSRVALDFPGCPTLCEVLSVGAAACRSFDWAGVAAFDVSGVGSCPEPCSGDVSGLFLVTGSPFLPRRGFEELASCCVRPVVESAYASGRSDIKSVAVRTVTSDVRTALSFILELQWFDSKRERLAYAIGRLGSGVRFDVGPRYSNPRIWMFRESLNVA